MINKKKNCNKLEFITSSIIIIILLSIFATYPISAEISLEENLQDVIIANQNLDLTEEEKIIDYFMDYIYYYTAESDVDSSDIELKKSSLNFPFISINRAIEDVDFLFEVLKYGYAGYQLYGGDESFGKARKNILAELDASTSFLGRISRSNFRDMIIDSLSFIGDAHFAFDGEQFGDNYTMYISNDYSFQAVEDGFVLLDGEESLYFSKLAGKEADEVLWPSLDDNAQLVYRPGLFLSVEKEELLEIMILERRVSVENKETNNLANRVVEEELALMPMPVYNVPSWNEAYTRREEEGIPVIRVNSLMHTESNLESLNRFVEEGKELANEEAIIIDLRGNSGGSDSFASNWFKSFLGREISSNIIYIDLKTEISRQVFLNNVREMNNDQKLIELVNERFYPVNSGWGEPILHLPERIDNYTLLLVLIDSRTASAGENFVRQLRQVNNVVLIGSNTRGLIITGNVGSYSLPNSNFKVNSPVSLAFDTDLVYREGMGYMPDIWVDPNKALEIALELVK
ncbi:S41 family peptidase [Natronospora cellulosivora (SeqCode)]